MDGIRMTRALSGHKRGPQGIFPGEHRNRKYKATGEFRCPRKGEAYLSGAIVAAYVAPNDIDSPYWIAARVEMIRCSCCNGTGETAVALG